MALDFIAGCVGGCAGLVVGYPLDTVKVHIQTQDSKNPAYRGTWDCFQQLVRKDGLRGVFRGMSSPLAGVAFVNAVIFGTYGNIVKTLPDPDSLRSHFIAGSTAGFLQSFIASPMELTKIRMQVMSNNSSLQLYRSPFHCFMRIIRTEGLKGCFRGQMATTLREVPGFGAYFLSYEWLTRKMSKRNNVNVISPSIVLLSGGLAGITSWVVTYPIDVIKTRIQTDGINGTPKLKGIIHCFQVSIQNEGWAVLSKGLSSTVIRAFPTNAATFAVVSWVMNTFDGSPGENESQYWWEFRKTTDNLIFETDYSFLKKNIPCYQPIQLFDRLDKFHNQFVLNFTSCWG